MMRLNHMLYNETSLTVIDEAKTNKATYRGRL
jgi:hypothetical protein